MKIIAKNLLKKYKQHTNDNYKQKNNEHNKFN